MTALSVPRSVRPARSSAVAKRRAVTALRWLGIALLGVWCLGPPAWMVISSLKGPAEILNNSLIPSGTLENFRAIFSAKNAFGLAVRNSVVIAGIATVATMVIGTSAGYALAHKRFRYKRATQTAILAASMFPPIAILTPLFKLFTDAGWVNQYQAMIIPDVAITLPLTVWILTSFFRQMPWELAEAAKIDGASDVVAFWRIIFPLAAPGVFTAAILAFVAVWNEFLVASAMSLSRASQPVTVAVAQFTGASSFEQPFGSQMAAGTVVTIPLIILVLVFQRRIISGLTAGSSR